MLETAFCSGLRVGELRKLTPGHLDTQRGGLTLDAAWTKNRRAGFQPLPSALLERLSTWVETKEALRLYALNFELGRSKGTYPQNPLLYVPRNPSRSPDRALKAAGIPKVTSAGKVDFHACRVVYITMVFESGATLKEAQELARHLSPGLTVNVYARARDERLSDIVEQVGQSLDVTDNYAHSMHQIDTGESYLSVFVEDTTMPKGGFEPPAAADITVHEHDTSITQTTQNLTLKGNPSSMSTQKDIISEHPQDIFLHREYGIYMGDLPDDLRVVIDAWDRLPEAVKAGIIAMVKAASQ